MFQYGLEIAQSGKNSSIITEMNFPQDKRLLYEIPKRIIYIYRPSSRGSMNLIRLKSECAGARGGGCNEQEGKENSLLLHNEKVIVRIPDLGKLADEKAIPAQLTVRIYQLNTSLNYSFPSPNH